MKQKNFWGITFYSALGVLLANIATALLNLTFLNINPTLTDVLGLVFGFVVSFFVTLRLFPNTFKK